MGGGPPTQQRTPTARSGGMRGETRSHQHGTPPHEWAQAEEAEEGASQPQQRTQTARGKEGAGDRGDPPRMVARA